MTPRSGGTTRAGPDGPNEDALLVDDERRFYAVSDGVGQYRGAAVASALVVEACRDALAGGPPPDGDLRGWLGRAASRAARALHARGRAEPALGSMAATLTALQLVDGAWWIVHVGDTRAYLLRDGRLEQLTRDHSVAWEQYEAGGITRDQLRTHPNQNLLTRTLIARREFVVPDVVTGDLRPGDRLLLCSDGVIKVLDEGRVAETLAAGDDPQAVAEAVVARADRLGLTDDATALMVLIG
ncbi:MAG: protein phosphatase 2C domain-containing protein [Planctomycetes bacterium]|nr:protein phosphatase 2C domain-containing protein [Planctomycetota bacterium]